MKSLGKIESLMRGSINSRNTGYGDDAVGVTRSMRGKENANDYRYFLKWIWLLINADIEYVEKITPYPDRDALGTRGNRIVEKYKISFEESLLLTERKS